jgi:putative transposase
MRELSAQYPRYGYRFIAIFLARAGMAMNPKRVYRLWRKALLTVPRKRPRKRVATSRLRHLAPTGPNEVWAYDFVFDACANGQILKCLTIIDEFTRESLDYLDGAPRYLRSDKGPEFVSRDVVTWLHAHGIDTAFIAPGKPRQNGDDESFIGRFRDE